MFKTGLQLNRITSGQHKTDNNNRVVTLTTNIAFNNKVQWDRQFLITIDQRFPTWPGILEKSQGVHQIISITLTKGYTSFIFSAWGYVSRKRLGNAAIYDLFRDPNNNVYSNSVK